MAKPEGYDEMTDKQKARYDKWSKRGDAMTNTGKGMQQAGGKMMGCGCLLTILVTIPIIIIVLFFL